jgi:hypothetical protein
VALDFTSWENDKPLLEKQVATLSEQLRVSRRDHHDEVTGLRRATGKEIAALKVEVEELQVAAEDAANYKSKSDQLEDDLTHSKVRESELRKSLKDKEKLIKEAGRNIAKVGNFGLSFSDHCDASRTLFTKKIEILLEQIFIFFFHMCICYIDYQYYRCIYCTDS